MAIAFRNISYWAPNSILFLQTTLFITDQSPAVSSSYQKNI